MLKIHYRKWCNLPSSVEVKITFSHLKVRALFIAPNLSPGRFPILNLLDFLYLFFFFEYENVAVLTARTACKNINICVLACKLWILLRGAFVVVHRP